MPQIAHFYALKLVLYIYMYTYIIIVKVPFAHMWSPHFVPRPKDWPDYVDIIGILYVYTYVCMHI
jgi:hypothetical protein